MFFQKDNNDVMRVSSFYLTWTNMKPPHASARPTRHGAHEMIDTNTKVMHLDDPTPHRCYLGFIHSKSHSLAS